jgi:hypothetical protein
MKQTLSIGIILIIISFFSCSKKSDQSVELFNGKDLTGWDVYIGPLYDTAKKDFNSSNVPGLNNDPHKVFSVVEMDGKNAIRVSGEDFGGISTVSVFKNYQLTLEFKWGRNKSEPRKNQKRDSGLLYHAVGEHGADYGFWMRSQEFQIQEGDCGDYWGVAGGSFDAPAKQQSEDYVYDENSPLATFNESSPIGRHCIKNPDAENPTGEWNKIELYVLGDTAIHIVNGTVNMMLYHSAQLENGKLISLKEGKIQIQSEGAEVFYRHINLNPINKLPEAL